jgi:Flp pilus assembly protein TadD
VAPSARREQLAQLLTQSPDDVFLRYALAMEIAKEGDLPEAVSQLAAITDDEPDYVPAWFQRGQLLAREGESDQARDVLRQGIDAARRTGDAHAEGEMTGFLETL